MPQGRTYCFQISRQEGMLWEFNSLFSFSKSIKYIAPKLREVSNMNVQVHIFLTSYIYSQDLLKQDKGWRWYVTIILKKVIYII
jgi:hypothetical protein